MAKIKMIENEQNIKTNSIRQNIGYICSMMIVFFVLGLIISTQTKKHIEAENSGIPAARKLDELVLILKEAQNKKSDLEKQLTRLRQQMHSFNKESLPAGLSNRQFQKLYQIAGLTSVKGNGIILNINDSGNIKISSPDNDGLVHSDDILKIINEIKASGAKAIAINNQRLVTTSEIVTAGNSIMVNQSRLTPPYIIKAIGPSNTMISALKMRGGIIEYLEVFGIKINIEIKPDLTIPPYTGSLS
ncbi:MAG: DUF881 domain-containing protein [Candidatus Gastranaerophilales bacterium]|nr:DUF881 domain-containing protein [Candidatus Gastranaerophilales bacterium]